MLTSENRSAENNLEASPQLLSRNSVLSLEVKTRSSHSTSQISIFLQQAASLKDVQELAKQFAYSNINPKTMEGVTALHEATRAKQWECVDFLLKSGVDPKTANEDGLNYLFHLVIAVPSGAIFKRQLESLVHSVGLPLLTLNQLLAAKDKKGKTLLHHAAEQGKTELISLLANEHHLLRLINEKDNQGCTPLHLAAKQGHLSSVEELYKLKANPYLLNYEGNNAIHVAECSRQVPVLQFFAARHAEAFQKSSDLVTVRSWEAAATARIEYFDSQYEQTFRQVQQEKQAQANQLQADLKESKAPQLEEEELTERFQSLQLGEKIRGSLAQLISNLEPDNPAAASALLMLSDLYLLKASHWSQVWKTQLKQRGDQPKVFKTAVSFYRAAMHYAVCSQVVESRYVEERHKYPGFQSLVETQIERVIMRYRQEMLMHKVSDVPKHLNYKNHQQNLKKHRANLEKEVNTPELKIQEISRKNTKYFRALTKELWEEAIGLMDEKPPCTYALMGFGSMAREIMSPYSDLEFGILTERDSKSNNPLLHQFERRYFKIASCLMELLTIAIGETPASPLVRTPLEHEDQVITFQNDISLESMMVFGFQFDTGGLCTPAGKPKVFLGTVNQLLGVHTKTDDESRVQSAILRTICFITGNAKLLKEYHAQLTIFLEETGEESYFSWFFQSNTRRKTIALQAMQQNVKDFELTLGRVDQEITKNNFNIKTSWYHFPARIVESLALYYGLPVLNDFERIKELRKYQHLSTEGADILYEHLSRVLRLRFTAHLHYQSEHEAVHLPDSVPQLPRFYEKPSLQLTPAQFEKIIALYQTLQPLQKASCEFINKKGQSNVFAASSFIGNDHLRLSKQEGCRLKAEAYEKLNHPKQAMHWYQIAFQLDPQNEAIQVNYLRFLNRQYNECVKDVRGVEKQGIRWIEKLISISAEQKVPAEIYSLYLKRIPYSSDFPLWRGVFYQAIRKYIDKPHRLAILALLPDQSTEMKRDEESEASKEELKKAWREQKIAAITQKQMDELDRGEAATLLTARKADQPEIREEFNEKRVNAYENAIVSNETTPLQKTLVIQQGFALLDKVRKDKNEATRTAWFAQDRTLKLIVNYLLIKGLAVSDYILIYQKLPSDLRRSFRLAIQARIEKPLERKEELSAEHAEASEPQEVKGEEDKYVSKPQPVSQRISASKAFLVSLLKELNSIPDPRGERPLWEKHKLEWHATLQRFIAKPADNKERKGGPAMIKGSFIYTGSGDKKEYYEAKLNPLVQDMLFTTDHAFKGESINGSRHLLAKVEVNLTHGKKRWVFCKANPEMPGMSFLIERLHHQLIGHGTSLSELVGIALPGKPPLPILISEAIEGQTLAQVLEEKPHCLNKLFHKHISELALLAMITNPEDGSPSNYIIRPVEVDNELYLTLVSVDHDHALFQPYDDFEENKEGFSKPKLQVKTILFCLDNMLQPIDPKARDAFCHLDAGKALRTVLQEAQDHDKAYRMILKETFGKLYESKTRDNSSIIPIPLKDGDVIKIYQKIQRLQRYLKNEENANATLLACLLVAEPRVGLAYSHVLSQEINPRERLKTVGEYKDEKCISHNRARQSLLVRTKLGKEEYARLAKCGPIEGLHDLDVMDHQYLKIADIQAEVLAGKLESFHALEAEDHKAMVINGVQDTLKGIDVPPLDWRRLKQIKDEESEGGVDEVSIHAIQRSLLNAIKNIPFKYLQFAYCDALARPILKSIVSASPDLTELHLSHQPNIRQASLLVLNKHPGLQVLKLKSLSQLDAIQNLTLPALKVLIVTDAPELDSISIKAPHLKIVRIARCPQLKRLETGSQIVEELSCSELPELSPSSLTFTNWYAVKLLKLRNCSQLAEWQELIEYPFLIAIFEHQHPAIRHYINAIKSMLLAEIEHETLVSLAAPEREKLAGCYMLFMDSLLLRKNILSKLLLLLTSEESEVRRIACKALGKAIVAKPRRATIALKETVPLLEDKEPEVRRAACIIMGEIVYAKPKLGSKALKYLLPLLEDKEGEVRGVAYNVMGKIVTLRPELIEKALEPLLPVLSDTLSEIMKTSPESGEKIFRKLLLLFTTHRDYKIRKSSCLALSTIVNVRQELAEEVLIKLQLLLATENNYKVIAAACMVLSSIASGNPELADQALRLLFSLLDKANDDEQWKDPDVRLSAYSVLRQVASVVTRPEIGEEILKRLSLLFSHEKRKAPDDAYAALANIVIALPELTEKVLDQLLLILNDGIKNKIIFSTIFSRDNDIYSSLKKIINKKPELAEKICKQVLLLLKSENGDGQKGEMFWLLSEIVKVKPELADEVLKQLQPLLDSINFTLKVKEWLQLFDLAYSNYTYNFLYCACNLLGDIAVAQPELGEEALRQLKELLGKKEDANNVCYNLSKIVQFSQKLELQEKALSLLLTTLTHNDDSIKDDAYEELIVVAHKKPKIAEELIRRMKRISLDDRSYFHASSGVSYCSKLSDLVKANPLLGEEALKQLKPLFNDDKAQACAYLALGNIVDVRPDLGEKALNYLLPVLTTKNISILHSVCKALGNIISGSMHLPAGEEALRHLLTLYLYSEKPSIRSNAEKTLFKIIEQCSPAFHLKIFALLEPLTRNSDIHVECAAIEACMVICNKFDIFSSSDIPTFFRKFFKKLHAPVYPEAGHRASNQPRAGSKSELPVATKTELPFLVEEKAIEQRGWNCFDVAIELPRERLVSFALEHKRAEKYLKMLAPEIRTAAAITAIMMNMQEEKEGAAKQQVTALAELFNLFEVARQFGTEKDQKEMASSIHSLLFSRKSPSDGYHLSRQALPERMRTKEVQALVNDYNKAHEDIKPLLAQCNELLGNPVGRRLSFDDLNLFFSQPENRRGHEAAWQIFEKALQQFFPHEKALNDYCERPDVYEAYVQEYYGKKQWAAFQPASSGRQNSSMVDVAADCLEKQIIIYQMKGKEREEIYRTAEHKGGAIYIQYNGHNHFTQLKLNSTYFAAVEKQLLELFSLFKPRPAAGQPPALEMKDDARCVPKIIAGYLA